MTDSPSSSIGLKLDSHQLRVLGALVEKEIATPEQYPLSLNSLVNACNQRSSRDPVLDLTERDVFAALQSLEDENLVHPIRDARVAKYEHRARTVFNLRRDETAILCLLLLRGPQTPGELRSRSDRLYAFDDLASVQSTLDRLASRAPTPDAPPDPLKTTPLTVQLARQPGAREARYAHLLGDQPIPSESTVSAPRASAPSPSRIEELEASVAALRQELHTILERLARLESAGVHADLLE